MSVLEELKRPTQNERKYTNHAHVYASPFDVVIEAGVKGPPGDTVDIHSILVMSPEMAKLLSRLLAATISQWESKHGEIPLSGQLKSRVGTGPEIKPS